MATPVGRTDPSVAEIPLSARGISTLSGRPLARTNVPKPAPPLRL